MATSAEWRCEAILRRFMRPSAPRSAPARIEEGVAQIHKFAEREFLGTPRQQWKLRKRDAPGGREVPEGVAQGLPALAEGRADHLPEELLVACRVDGPPAHPELHDKGHHTRFREKGARRYLEQGPDLRIVAAEDGEYAIVARPRSGEHPAPDLFLYCDRQVTHRAPVCRERERVSGW